MSFKKIYNNINESYIMPKVGDTVERKPKKSNDSKLAKNPKAKQNL